MLGTSNSLLAGIWATAEGSTPIAAFLLDIGGSERPLSSDFGLKPVMIKGRYSTHGPSSEPLGGLFKEADLDGLGWSIFTFEYQKTGKTEEGYCQACCATSQLIKGGCLVAAESSSTADNPLASVPK